MWKADWGCRGWRTSTIRGGAPERMFIMETVDRKKPVLVGRLPRSWARTFAKQGHFETRRPDRFGGGGVNGTTCLKPKSFPLGVRCNRHAVPLASNLRSSSPVLRSSDRNAAVRNNGHHLAVGAQTALLKLGLVKHSTRFDESASGPRPSHSSTGKSIASAKGPSVWMHRVAGLLTRRSMGAESTRRRDVRRRVRPWHRAFGLRQAR